jgi:hypothetical protein
LRRGSRYLYCVGVGRSLLLTLQSLATVRADPPPTTLAPRCQRKSEKARRISRMSHTNIQMPLRLQCDQLRNIPKKAHTIKLAVVGKSVNIVTGPLIRRITAGARKKSTPANRIRWPMIAFLRVLIRRPTKSKIKPAIADVSFTRSSSARWVLADMSGHRCRIRAARLWARYQIACETVVS